MAAMDPRLAFPRVAVAGGPAVDFCVVPGDGDPVVPWLLEHDWIDEPVQRAFRALVEPGMRVLDGGSHLGVFALPAAAIGAEVLAVDGNARHVDLLREAARRNGFEERLEVVNAAITAQPGTVEFVERGIHGHLRVEVDGGVDTVSVVGMTVPELLADGGWNGVDLVKLDIEGGEVGALAGMAPLFAAGARPALVFECNGDMLRHHGTSVVALRRAVLELGYELLMIDHLRPGVLVEVVAADGIQPECSCDYVALAAGRPPRLESEWSIEPPFTLEDTVRRVADMASDAAEGYRLYAAELVAEGPAWLRDDPALRPARRALALDAPRVRAAFATRDRPGRGAAHADAAVPRGAEIVVAARDVALPARPGEVDRAVGQPGAETSVSGLDVAVPAGRLLAVRAQRPADASALLRALAGWRPPLAGEVTTDPSALLVDADGAGIEPSLSVEENLAVFAAFSGAGVAGALDRADELATLAKLGDPSAPLTEWGEAGAARLMLVVAFEHARPRALLVDALPDLGDAFTAWARAATRDLLAAGGVVVQAGEPLLAPAGVTLELRAPAAVAA
jgi:FkbM family methyltransferase